MGVCMLKLCGDDHPAELGEHVGDRGLGLVTIPGGQPAGCGDVVGVVAGGGVQQIVRLVMTSPNGTVRSTAVASRLRA